MRARNRKNRIKGNIEVIEITNTNESINKKVKELKENFTQIKGAWGNE